MHQVRCVQKSFSQSKLINVLHFLLVVSVLGVSSLSVAEDFNAYSTPFHKQGGGWLPSIYWSTGRNLGSYYLPNTDGPLFEEAKDWDTEQDAIVYFYRPNSQWASEETTAPTYYINDEQIFNLRSGSYTYVELPAGSYDFAVRKSVVPLFGFEAYDDKLMMAFDLNLQLNIGLSLAPGSITYIRHSEVSLPAVRYSKLEEDDEMASADVQLVDRELAMTEMPETRYLLPSFWSSTDAAKAEELLSGTMQEYGWFTVIWPWSNNFIFGFPIFYLPSDIYHQLQRKAPMTIEQELYLLADDTEAYLDEIIYRRKIKRNWLAPWRKPRNPLTLNDELILDRLERAAKAGEIVPAPVIIEKKDPVKDDGEPWWAYFTIPEKPKSAAEIAFDNLSGNRRKNALLIKQTLN